MKIERYIPSIHNNCPTMKKAATGGWVAVEDVLRLQSELSAMRARAERARKALSELIDTIEFETLPETQGAYSLVNTTHLKQAIDTARRDAGEGEGT